MADLFDRFYLPEDVGISSIAVANFLQECDKAHYKLRTLHIIRHGKAVVEAARYPFRASDKRLVYSVSKTFTSTAIGFAVQEGLVNVNDPAAGLFPGMQRPRHGPPSKGDHPAGRADHEYRT